MKKVFSLLAAIALLAPLCGQSAWNSDWSNRTKITLNTTAAGVETKSELTSVPVLVRLHTGKFMFTDALENGADLRFVAGDDKTPLKFHIEQFDPVNELALIWVQVPKIAPSSDKDAIWLYYGNSKAAPADDPKGTYDVNQVLVFHFGEKKGLPKDTTAYGNNVSQSTAKSGAGAPIGFGVTFDGSSRIVVPASPSLQFAQGMTFSAWLKIDGSQKNAVVYAQQNGAKAVQFLVSGTNLNLRVNNGGKPLDVAASSGLTLGSWHHVAFVLGDRATVYVDGKEAGTAAASARESSGDVTLGSGLKGEMDEAQLSNVARSADWIRIAAASQGAESALLNFGEGENSGGDASASYLAILLGAVTLDGWVVIGILMVMALVSLLVMIGKTRMVAQAGGANQRFRDEFARSSQQFLSVEHYGGDAGSAPAGPAFRHSTLYRVYDVGMRELKHRFELYDKKGLARSLSPQALSAIKASIDAGLVRENQKLNSQLVLLTIAISGGPFLGLLGTVVGVMITFAAIAAAGDVNVNAIAPGIAAALVATVAGLAVAIPALFGYNYLASKIRSISDDTAVFSDEFITRLAEDHSP